MKKIMIYSFLFLLFGCKEEQNNNLVVVEKPLLKLEKIIVINLDDVPLTYFKIHVTNKNRSSIVFLDNSLKEHSMKRLKSQKMGFYLKNIKNDSIITLGIDNYNFYEVGGNRTGYLYMAANNVYNSCKQKDSLLLKKMLRDYVLEYNGEKLDLDNIKKTNYISQPYFDQFKKRNKEIISFNDSLTIIIPNNIDIKYYKNIPVYQKDWDML